MTYIGDKSNSVNTGLDEADMEIYVCPVCGAEKPVLVKYDGLQGMFFPVSFEDTQCDCGNSMDRKGRA